MNKTFTVILLMFAVLILLLNAALVGWRQHRQIKARKRIGIRHLLSRRFSVLLGLISLAYLFTSVIVERIERDQMVTLFQEMELYDARQMARNLQRQFQSIREQLREIVIKPQVLLNTAAGERAIANYYSLMDKRWVRTLSRVSATGHILYTQPDESKKGQDVSGQPHNREMLAKPRSMVSAPFHAVQGFRAIAVMEPVFKGTQFAGWVTALIDLDDLTANFIQPTTTGGITKAGLVSQDGMILAFTMSDGTTQSMREMVKNDPAMLEFSEKVLRDVEGTIRYKRSGALQGQGSAVAQAAAFARIPLGGNAFWVAGVTAHEADIIDHFHNSKWPHISIMLLFLTMIILASIERLRDEQRYAEKLEQEISSRLDDLRRSEGRFSTFFEQCPVGLMLLDAAGNCLSVNPGFGQIFGIPSERFQSYNLLQDKAWEQSGILPLLNSAFAGQGANFVEALIQTGSQGLFANLPQRSVTVRGAIYPNFNDQGTVTTVLFTCMDITGREQAAEARLLLSTVVEQSAEAIFVTDTQGLIHYVNPAFCALTGFQPADVLGLKARVLLGDPAARRVYRRLVRTLALGRPWSGHIANRRRDRTIYEVESVISPVRDNFGKIIHYVSVNRDVTLELALEAQLRQSQKMEAIGKLAGGVAHDFNNVLTAIVGNLQLAQRLPSESRMQKFLRDALVASERATEMVRQLLTFSRKSSDLRQAVNLNALVRETVGLVEKSIDRRITLVLNLDDPQPPVMADPNQIHQVIMNLCVNARDALMACLAPAHEGADALPADAVRRAYQITIQTRLEEVGEAYCRLHPFAHPGCHIMLAVHDEGVGMDRETLARIFEPFFTTKAVNQGTGLGLSIVYGIVKSHNGWIQVESECSQGSTFVVYLPVSLPADDASPTRSPHHVPAIH